jgi:hypothetical protein
MPLLKHANPTYRKHKASGQAMVTIDRRDFYLGPWKTNALKAAYDRIVGEWLANGRRMVAVNQPCDLTVTELLDRFWDHVEVYYRHPDGTPTSEVAAFKLPLAILNRLYGATPAAQFGPLALEAIRSEMIAKGWKRASINKHTGRLKHMFKWAVSKELIPASVHHALITIGGLRAGKALRS